MNQQEIEAKRKRFFMGVSAIATAITLVSASATFTLNEQSFTDWDGWAPILAVLATAGTEAAFSLALYGVTYALTAGAEKQLGIALLLGTVSVMAANYVIHHKKNIGARLGDWQVAYIQWIGPLSLFGILLLIVGIIIYNHDSKKRAQDREFALAADKKALQWRQQVLESDAFNAHMAQYEEQVYEEARKSLKLSAPPQHSPAYGKTRIGYRDEGYDPKGHTNRD